MQRVEICYCCRFHEYPLPAIREALLNAVIHRNYTDGSDIQIKIFDDKITIFSPGLLYGGLKLEELQLDNYRSSLCNKLAIHDPAPVPVIRIDLRYFRPTEVETLLGDPSKAKQKLGWVPEITLDELVQEMVATDLAEANKHALLKLNGYTVNVSAE